jgi:hypothetical protein
MHRRSDSLLTQPKLRAYYGIGALAEVAGMTRHVMLRLPRRSKVRFVRLGRASLVPLTELEERVPTLWRYLRGMNEGQRVATRWGRSDELGERSATLRGRRRYPSPWHRSPSPRG